MMAMMATTVMGWRRIWRKKRTHGGPLQGAHAPIQGWDGAAQHWQRPSGHLEAGDEAVERVRDVGKGRRYGH